jgi:hypothetical protein
MNGQNRTFREQNSDDVDEIRLETWSRFGNEEKREEKRRGEGERGDGRGGRRRQGTGLRSIK